LVPTYQINRRGYPYFKYKSGFNIWSIRAISAKKDFAIAVKKRSKVRLLVYSGSILLYRTA
jgi:hypothetical protein